MFGERSLSLVMRDAKDNVGEALRKLRAHYTGSGKPIITTLYNQLTTLKISYSESITLAISLGMEKELLHLMLPLKR